MKPEEPLTIFKTYDAESNTYTYELLTQSLISVSEEFDKENDEEDLKKLFRNLKQNTLWQLNNDDFVIKEIPEIA